MYESKDLKIRSMALVLPLSQLRRAMKGKDC